MRNRANHDVLASVLERDDRKGKGEKEGLEIR